MNPIPAGRVGGGVQIDPPYVVFYITQKLKYIWHEKASRTALQTSTVT